MRRYSRNVVSSPPPKPSESEPVEALAAGGVRGIRDTRWDHLLSILRSRRRGLVLAVATGLVWTVGKISIPLLTREAIDGAIDVGGSALNWALVIVAAAFHAFHE